MARPTQSLAALASKKAPWPQSCWIMNIRTRKTPAGKVKIRARAGWPKFQVSQPRIQQTARAAVVRISSNRLRPRSDFR